MKKYKLVIVESPSKATTIGKYLGSDFKVIASKGHIFNLPAKDLGIDIENKFKQKLEPLPDKKKTIAQIKDLSKNASEIFLAPDPDREGEAIAFHIKKAIGKHPCIKRVTFNSITKETVNEAIKNPTELDKPMYEAQQSRRVIDRLVGYKISPILWSKFTGGLSAGRVQSVALRLTVDREMAIHDFNPVQSFSISAFLESQISPKLINHTLREKFKAEDITSKIGNSDFIVHELEDKVRENKPSAPFTTSKLQQEASSRLDFKAKDTMQYAQKLYEGIFIKSRADTVGLITYMRTDSVRTEPAKLDELRKFITQEYGNEYLSESTNTYGGKGKIQDAHEAIRPTYIELTPEIVKDDLPRSEYLLYKLIWEKYTSSQMSNNQQSQSVVVFEAEGFQFKTTGTILKFIGFKKIYQDKSKSKDIVLPKLVKGQKLKQVKELEIKEHWTKPPARFTESTLVKELEEKGIGRPSTYASILSNIIDREYIVEKEKFFHPTKVGTSLTKILVKFFPAQLDISYTALIESSLDQIAEGNLNYLQFLETFWTAFSESLASALSSMPQIKVNYLPLGLECPKCQEVSLDFFFGRNPTVKCRNCKHTEVGEYGKGGNVKLKGQKKIINPCPKCGEEVILKHGKYGDFFACTGYPNCNYTKQKTTGIPCFCCKDGEYVEKISKNGKKYWKCSNSPKCQGILWNQPIKRKCQHCFNPVLESREKGDYCPSCKKFQ